MDYFWIKIDERLERGLQAPRLTEEEIEGKEPLVKFIKIREGLDETVFQDYLTTFTVKKQYSIISDRLKKLMSIYDKRREWVPIVFIDQHETQHLYWFLSLDEVDCISGETAYGHGGLVTDLVLDGNKLDKKRSMFLVRAERQKIVAVNLDLVESMLRRGFYGFTLKRATVR